MYTKELKLEHNQLAAIVNAETGEIRVLEPKAKKEPKDRSMEYFESDQPYQRVFTKAWKLLQTQTTDLEFKIAVELGMNARAYTNSLEPLTPETTATKLSDILNVDRKKIGKVFDKLFKLGVIGKFEVYDRFEIHHNYWIFNPYLSFNGKTIRKDVKTMFDNTYYANLDRI